MNTATNIILVNNTGSDLRMFDAVLIECVKSGNPLPCELADLLNLNVITVDDAPRGVITWA